MQIVHALEPLPTEMTATLGMVAAATYTVQ